MPRPVVRRPGFTLIEMMISITIMMLIFAMAVPFFRAQARSVEQNAQRLDARTGGRYGASSLDRDLRVAGIGMPAEQPLLVQAQYDAVTINANLVSPNDADVRAVYVNPDVDAGLTGALTPATAVTLPNSSWRYPEAEYADETEASTAETISYWVAPDAERPGFSALFRRVNRGEPRVVVRNVIMSESQPVFRYYFVNSDGRLTEVPSTRMPLRHVAARHGDGGDTASFGFIDTVRVVRVRLRTVARDAQTGRVDTLAHESSIRMMNAGLLKRTTCGATPRPPAYDPAPIRAPLVSGRPRVEFSFLASPDEPSGERDVQRYVIYRRLEAASGWGEPLASFIIGGVARYPFEDPSAEFSQRYVYGIAAMDCTPRLSPIVASEPVSTPAAPSPP